jgi:hypothetical protein
VAVPTDVDQRVACSLGTPGFDNSSHAMTAMERSR